MSNNILVYKGILSDDEVSKRTIYLNTVYKDSMESFKQLITITCKSQNLPKKEDLIQIDHGPCKKA